MATELREVDAEKYQAGRETMHDHLKETFPTSERMGLQEIQGHAQGHREAVQMAHVEKQGRYSDPDFTAGAKAGAADWERERIQESERQSVRVRVA